MPVACKSKEGADLEVGQVKCTDLSTVFLLPEPSYSSLLGL